MSINIYDIHEQMTAHLFPAYSSTDERFLTLALCGECGELANMIKKRWRDGVDLTPEIREEICDIRVYLELIAKCFDIEGDKLDMAVIDKLKKVVEKHKVRLSAPSPLDVTIAMPEQKSALL
jgi:NTP pyrophosphatase (non-canonical NTP hydrolase)